MMKKLLTLFLLLALMLPQLAACTTGGGTESSTDTADTTDAEQTTEEPAVDIPDNLMLKTMAGFALKGKTLRMNLAHEDPVLDLSGRFSAEEDGAKISFSKDEAGNEPLEERKLSLSEGENVFYLKVSFRKESFVYKGIVNYRSAYTVEFYSNCKEYVPTQTVDKGATLQRPTTPTRNGYLFLGWHLDGKLYDFSKAPTKSCTLIAHWEKFDKDSGYYTSETEGVAGLKFEYVNAGLHIVWKDYADCNGLRPNEVTCILTQTYGTTEKTYLRRHTGYNIIRISLFICIFFIYCSPFCSLSYLGIFIFPFCPEFFISFILIRYSHYSITFQFWIIIPSIKNIS